MTFYHQLVGILCRFILHNVMRYSYLAISTALAKLPEPKIAKIVGGTSASNAVREFSLSKSLIFNVLSILPRLKKAAPCS